MTNDFQPGDKVSYQKNKRERAVAVVNFKSTSKKDHYYIKPVDDPQSSLLVPAGELVKVG